MAESAVIYYPDFKRKVQPSDTRVIVASVKSMPFSASLRILKWLFFDEPCSVYELTVFEEIYPWVSVASSRSLPQVYSFKSSSAVKFQILWEMGRISSNGYLIFKNHTCEPDICFTEPEWLKASPQ
jgi:hypothetical protein